MQGIVPEKQENRDHHGNCGDLNIDCAAYQLHGVFLSIGPTVGGQDTARLSTCEFMNYVKEGSENAKKR